MKRFTVPLKVACTALIPLLAFTSEARTPNSRPPRPHMWVDKKIGMDREKLYDTKHDLLLKYTGIDQPKEIAYPEFYSMLKYISKHRHGPFQSLHVYIAAYPAAGPRVPAGWEDKLTLIFAPADGSGREYAWYTIPPGGKFDPKDTVRCVLDDTVKNEWCDNYANNVMKYLLADLEEDDCNMYQGKKSDTRMIAYSREDIIELRKEFTRNHKIQGHRVKFAGMKAYFAAYPPTGEAAYNNKFKNRLYVLFEFTDPDGNIRYLDDTDDFNLRKIQANGTSYLCVGKKDRENSGDIRILSNDNGQLCPPNCP